MKIPVRNGSVIRGAGVMLACLIPALPRRTGLVAASYAAAWPIDRPGLQFVTVVPDEDEEAWYQSCQLLSDLYLEVGRPDLAVPCLIDFRQSSKSGARTLYKLGQAYEQLGDRAKAAKCYKQVTAYEGNPLAPDANDALQRLQQQV